MATKRTFVKTTGMKELEASLQLLTKATAKNTLKKVALKAAEVMRDAAKSEAPEDTGRLKESIVATTKTPKNYEVGKIAYHQAMKDTASKKIAVAAMKAARKENKATFAEAFTSVYVRSTPRKAGGKRGKVNYSALVEFGSESRAPNPFMRRAWENKQIEAMATIENNIEPIIQGAIKRAERKAARLAAKIKK